MRAVSVEDLKPGMILARTIVNDDMVVVLSEDTLLTKAHITRLTFLNIPVVYIKDDYELNRNYQNASSIFNRGNAFVKEYDSVVQEAQSIFDETSKSGTVPLEETQDMVKETIVPMARNSGAIDYLYELNHRSSDIYNHSRAVLARSRNTHAVSMSGDLADVVVRYFQYFAAVARRHGIVHMVHAYFTEQLCKQPFCGGIIVDAC